MSTATDSRAFGRQSACSAKIGSIRLADATMCFFVFSEAFAIRTRA
jgi:hypothetical protein